MTEAARSDLGGLIFTFSPEPTVPKDFIIRLQRQLAGEATEILFIKLICQDHLIKESRDF